MSDKEKVSGEEVEVVAVFDGLYLTPLKSMWARTELIDKAQHQRITEALRGELTACLLARSQEQESISSRVEYNFLEAERDQLRAEVERLKDALETESMRLAACGVAALGYFDGCAEEYHSASLHDVLALRAQLAQQQGVPEGWRRVLDRVRLTDEEARHYSPSAVAYWNNAVTACRCALDEIAPVQAEPASLWVAVSERLPEVPEGDEQEVIVCVQRAHNGQRYVFSARYLNNFTLHNDYDDELTLATGWHDVKEHADYDGWYSPLSLSDGDEIVGWMPLPPAPKVV